MAKRTVIHVVPSKKDGWDIKREGVNKAPLDHATTKAEAVKKPET